MRRLLVLFIAFLAFPVHAKALDEMVMRGEIRGQVAALWAKKDFDALDKLSTAFRVRRERTASGIWKLSVFNGALLDQVQAELGRGSSWQEIHDEAGRWSKRSPNSPAAQIFVAQALTAHAWAVRGNEYARLVKPENMQAFTGYVGRARKHLEAIKPVAAVDPTWYELMISLSTYSGRTVAETETLFAEAVGREPEYLQTYFVASTRFSPKWGGSADVLEGFMQRAVRDFSPSSGDAMYMRMAWWVLDLRFFDDPHGQSKLDCDRMMRGARKIFGDFPDPWNANNFVRFAAHCGDKESAAFFLRHMEGQPMKEVWGNYPPDYLPRIREFAK